MSGEALYERYKDALKRGHVASLRGKVDEALAAYAEAARIAPERSTPHTSAGTALMRRKRPADALRHYEAALRIGPRDEAALLGRAQALVALDRRADAADAFDALAEMQATSGKLADAVDAARRGLELAEGRLRRRTLERLIDRLRASEPGEPGRLALERALRVLEGPAIPVRPAAPTGPAAAAAEQAAMAAAADEAMAGDELDDAGPGVEAGREPEAAQAVDVAEPDRVEGVEGVGADAAVAAGEPTEPEEPTAPEEPTVPGPEGAVTPAEVVDAAGSEPEIEAVGAGVEPHPEAEPAPEAAPPPPEEAPVVPKALDRPLPDTVDLEALAREAELVLDSGDPSAPERFLDLAAASLREGRVNAALDACYQALSLDPDDTGIHLALVQLYDQEGWTGLANEKLDLLGRLADLGGDTESAGRIAAVRAARE